MTALTDLSTFWHEQYIEAARVAFPAETKGHELAVGWKATPLDGVTKNDYYWPLVNGDHDLPVLHEADNWNPDNAGSCPKRVGDGLCLVTDDGITEATSGNVESLGHAIMHVLVYPKDLVRSDTGGKYRTPWCIDVDCGDIVGLARLGLVANLRSANLRSANLTYANLTSADLTSADLTSANLRSANLRSANLTSADLTSADLTSANLRSADLTSANLTSANLRSADLASADLTSANLTSAKYTQLTFFPAGFDPTARGMVRW